MNKEAPPRRTDAPWTVEELRRRPGRTEQRVDGIRRHGGETPPRGQTEIVTFFMGRAPLIVADSGDDTPLIGGRPQMFVTLTVAGTTTSTFTLYRNGTSVGTVDVDAGEVQAVGTFDDAFEAGVDRVSVGCTLASDAEMATVKVAFL